MKPPIDKARVERQRAVALEVTACIERLEPAESALVLTRVLACLIAAAWPGERQTKGRIVARHLPVAIENAAKHVAAEAAPATETLQ